MSLEFYRKGEEIWMRATAGGHGGDATSIFESRANDNDIAQHWREHQVFLASEIPEADPSDFPQDAAPLSLPAPSNEDAPPPPDAA